MAMARMSHVVSIYAVLASASLDAPKSASLRGSGNATEMLKGAPEMLHQSAGVSHAQSINMTLNVNLKSAWPWSCPSTVDVCLGATNCKSGCTCWENIEESCRSINARNTGVSCHVMYCSWSGVSNAVCAGPIGKKRCLCNQGMIASGTQCVYDESGLR